MNWPPQRPAPSKPTMLQVVLPKSTPKTSIVMDASPFHAPKTGILDAGRVEGQFIPFGHIRHFRDDQGPARSPLFLSSFQQSMQRTNYFHLGPSPIAMRRVHSRLRIFMASPIPELAMHGSVELPCAIQKCLRAPRNRKASLPSASPTTAANRKGFG
jgi:hypothetical protein